MNTGDHVTVNFISESSTEFSGHPFYGSGTIHQIEDGRVFGRLYNGQPFMCAPSDVKVNVAIKDLESYYKVLLDLGLISQEELFQIKTRSLNDPALLNMSEFGLYIFAHGQSLFNELTQRCADLEFKLLQLEAV